MSFVFFDKTQLSVLNTTVKSLLAARDFKTAADFIKENFYSYAYIQAQNIMGKILTGEILEDEASHLAFLTMETIDKQFRSGTPGFSGGSLFSTYLVGVLKLQLKSWNKIYFPADVKRMGEPAKQAYYDLHIKNQSPEQVKNMLRWDFKLNEAEVAETMQTINTRELREQEMLRQEKRPGGNRLHSLDASEYEVHHSRDHTPEEKTVNKDTADKVRQAVEKLGEPDRTFILLTFFENKSLSEAEKTLGLNNGKYIRKRAMAKLQELLKDVA